MRREIIDAAFWAAVWVLAVVIGTRHIIAHARLERAYREAIRRIERLEQAEEDGTLDYAATTHDQQGPFSANVGGYCGLPIGGFYHPGMVGEDCPNRDPSR